MKAVNRYCGVAKCPGGSLHAHDPADWSGDVAIRKMHFGGGLRIETGARVSIRLAGWPCCCSGLRAMRMPREQLTNDATAVTCKACLSAMRRGAKP